MADIVLSPVLQVIFDRLASPILQALGDRWDLKITSRITASLINGTSSSEESRRPSEDQKAWDKLKPLFMGGICGSKIIITTRNKKVAFATTSPTYPYYLKELDEDDCWKLFNHQAFPQGEEIKYQNLVPIGKEITKKCGGVPLA
ncbi:hypothetical protein GH714_032436 [Hevea brasiliensis]|uniref:NB-ARC domain-containing protein n=1 Tax=Hevea brasiliensis TaxID=3981 RepID=A0A6A6N9U9_HEVBR|nr:hypothetical protein GH714_032436 [Hevea brasiliensis]